MFRLLFDSSEYGQGGDEYFFTSKAKAVKFMCKEAKDQKYPKLDWQSEIEFHFIQEGEDSNSGNAEILYCYILKLTVNPKTRGFLKY